MVSVVESMLGVIVTGVIGIIVYAWQEKIKRDIALSERRQELYEGLIRNLVELLTMRQDLRPTEVMLDEAAQHVKIYEWGIISKS